MALGCCADESAGRGMNNLHEQETATAYRTYEGTARHIPFAFHEIESIAMGRYVAGGSFQDKKLLRYRSAQKTKITKNT